MGNNLFSLGGLIDYLPSASPRAIIIKTPRLHRLFPNKHLLASGYSHYTPNTPIPLIIQILNSLDGLMVTGMDYAQFNNA